MFALNASVLFMRTSDMDPRKWTIQEYTVTKVGKSEGIATMWLDNHHKAEDCMYAMYVLPNTADSLAHLTKAQEMAIRHKQEESDLFAERLTLNNKHVNEGLR